MLKQLQIITKQQAYCDLPFRKIIVIANGDVIMCCHQEQILGNLFQQSILELYHGQLAQEIRSQTAEGVIHPVCSQRGTCPFINGKPEVGFVFDINKSRPLHLELCLPDTHCNIGGETPTKDRPACVMCPRNFIVNKSSVTIDQICEKIACLMPTLQEITIMGTAEPFWKDELFRVFDLIEFDKHKHHIEFFTNTNGTCHTKRTTDRFFAEVVKSSVTFSIDAASTATYQRIRRLDCYDKLIGNIRYYISKRNGNHKVNIMNNINILNVHEMTMMVECAADLGVDFLIMLPTNHIRGFNLSHILLNESNQEVFKKESERARERAEQLGVNMQYQSSFIYEKRQEEPELYKLEPLVP